MSCTSCSTSDRPALRTRRLVSWHRRGPVARAPSTVVIRRPHARWILHFPELEIFRSVVFPAAVLVVDSLIWLKKGDRGSAPSPGCVPGRTDTSALPLDDPALAPSCSPTALCGLPASEENWDPCSSGHAPTRTSASSTCSCRRCSCMRIRTSGRSCGTARDGRGAGTGWCNRSEWRSLSRRRTSSAGRSWSERCLRIQ
jgi:hypothetical protein